MKKFSIIFLMLCATINIFAQQMDKQEDDGSRIIISSAENLYSKFSTAAGFDLSTVIMPSGEQYWWLDLTLNEGKGQIDVGRVLLIKFDDGSVLELKNDKEIGPADYTYQVTKYGTNYYLHPRYPITVEQLDKLKTGNVTKVRVEHNIGYFDRDINTKKFNKRINKMYDEVISRMSISNDVRDGF